MDMKKNKKGFVMEMFAFIIIGIIAVAFFAVLIYGFGLLNTNLTNGKLDTSAANITDISSKTIGKLSEGMNNLRLISAIILIGFFIGTLISAYFSTKHPIWIFVYVLITILLVIFSIYISNAYTSMKADPNLSPIISGFGISDVIISYLPYWVTLLGFLGILLCVVGNQVSRRLI